MPSPSPGGAFSFQPEPQGLDLEAPEGQVQFSLPDGQLLLLLFQKVAAPGRLHRQADGEHSVRGGATVSFYQMPETTLLISSTMILR